MVSHGQALIQAFCYDCMDFDSSKEKLEEGIRCVQEALNLGFGDKGRAYKLLARGAVGRYTYARSEQKRVAEQIETLARQALEFAPDDPEVIELYASWTSDRELRVELYRRLTLHTGTPRDHYSLGLSLIAMGRIREAIAPLRLAFPGLHDPAAARNLVDRAVERMKQAGCPIDKPEVWSSEVNKIEMAALRSTSDAETKPREQELAGFTSRFLKAIEQAGCQE